MVVGVEVRWGGGGGGAERAALIPPALGKSRGPEGGILGPKRLKTTSTPTSAKQ